MNGGAGDAADGPKRKRDASNDNTMASKRNLPPTCTHDVAVPDGYTPDATLAPSVHGTLDEPIFTGDRAKTYPFELDPFQEIGVACLERRESVLVAAHTSAGKTVVAEYAIAMAFRDKQRVIYTSPLKALSNQKYRDLSAEFGDVGLMTGDVSLNPNANCIVMTTEILRSMLYRGSELLREVAWVVFDEIHYMQDRERGVVWEETIIFLPPSVRMVFLSATLSNAAEFCRWITHLHAQPCHVVYTDYRPTPLQHYAFPCGGKGLHLIVDEKGAFKAENFRRVAEALRPPKEPATNGDAGGASGGPGGGRGRGRSGRGGGRGGGRGDKGGGDSKRDMALIMRLIQAREMHPVIVFSFARRECEDYAQRLTQLDFTSADEKAEIEEVYHNAMEMLGEADRELPALTRMLPLLKRGIGVHHSGLLPILKELVEILFQEGKLKCLFTTETFAMGLNMPARCVVFTQMRKWDGQENRWVTSGEYIQMSGRAGRRGKDDRGICIMMLDDQLDERLARDIILGKPSPLVSSFKLSYYTLLNLLRRMEGSEQNMEYVIARSFQQFQLDRRRPQLEAELQRVEGEAAALGRDGDEALEEYTQVTGRLEAVRRGLQAVVAEPQHCKYFLQPGRLVRVQEGTNDWGWGVVVNLTAREGSGGYIMDTLLCCAPASIAAGRPKPGNLDEDTSEGHILPVALSLLAGIASLRIPLPDDLRPLEARRSVLLSLRGVLGGHLAGVPLLDPVADMNIQKAEVEGLVKEAAELEAKLAANPVFKAQKEGGRMEVFAKKAELAVRCEELRGQLRESQLGAFREEAGHRKAVLRRLGHIDENDVVLLKGKAACEIDTADELVAAELLLNGVLNGLDKHQLGALVSCLIPTERTNEQIAIGPALAKPLAQLQDIARHIGEVSKECKLEVEVEEYVQSFKPSLMQIVYLWSQGSSFAEVCGKTDIYEGTIVRACRRLDELMQQLARAAEVIGDRELAAKITESNETLRRDIMFTASLYVA